MKYLIKVILKAVIRSIIFILILPLSIFNYSRCRKVVGNNFLKYHFISTIFFQKFQKLPNLDEPKSFNEFINAYKFDEIHNAPNYSDKIEVKKLVAPYVKTLKTLEIYSNFNDIDFNMIGAYKLNNDSGGVYILDNVKNRNLLKEFELRIRALLGYGFWVQEWAYNRIPTRFFREEIIQEYSSVADFKFYIVNGKLIGCHYIYDRNLPNNPTKELWILADGQAMEWSIYPEFKIGSKIDFQLPKNWNQLCKLSIELGSQWKFVRVDLYNLKNEIYFGEFTFWPQAGFYKGKDMDKVWELFQQAL